MRGGGPSPAEHLLARVERGEISPAEALAALGGGRGPGVPPARLAPAACRPRPAAEAPSPVASRSLPPHVSPARSGAAGAGPFRTAGGPFTAAPLAAAPAIAGPVRPPALSRRPAPAPEPSALQELRSLTGLEEVKELIHELHAFLEMQKRRRAAGLRCEAQSLHMIFRGNPGTGKTTVARIVGRLFREMGLLEKGHLVEVERADLVGEYIGHTAQRAREQVKKALGGVLFVDEAYSLARGGEKDFGKEAIDVLVKAMEDHRHELVLILAGYREEMDWFLLQNPGLHSRFPLHIDFPDYSADELMRIADLMAAEGDYRLTDEARRVLGEWLGTPVGRWHRERGNARLVRNVLERAVRRQALRLARAAAVRDEDLPWLTGADIREALPEGPGQGAAAPRAPGWVAAPRAPGWEATAPRAPGWAAALPGWPALAARPSGGNGQRCDGRGAVAPPARGREGRET